MSKSDAIDIMKNFKLNKKSWIFIILLLYIKLSETTQYRRTRDVLLNRAKDYYKNDKERLRDNAKDKYKNLSEEEKKKMREYGRNRYHNTSEEKKQKLKGYQKYSREFNKSRNS